MTLKDEAPELFIHPYLPFPLRMLFYWRTEGRMLILKHLYKILPKLHRTVSYIVLLIVYLTTTINHYRLFKRKHLASTVERVKKNTRKTMKTAKRSSSSSRHEQNILLVHFILFFAKITTSLHYE